MTSRADQPTLVLIVVDERRQATLRRRCFSPADPRGRPVTGGLCTIATGAHVAPASPTAAAGVEEDAWTRRIGHAAPHPGEFPRDERVGGALHHRNDEGRER